MNFQTVKLKKIADVDWGNTNLTKSSFLQNGKFLAVSAAGIDGRIDHFEHNEHTIVISAIGANCGVVFYPGEKFTAIKNTITVSPNLSLVIGKYLFWFFKTNSFNRRGAGQPFLSKADTELIDIPLPPLETQKRIADILDTVDALRQKDQELLKKYDDLAQAIFIDMFGDPVKNEKGWEKAHLKDITLKIGSGATPTGGKTAYKKSGISLIRSMNVYDFSFKWKDLAFIDESQSTRLNNVTVQSKDVLFNITGASVCRCSIVPDEVLPARVNQHVAIIRPKSEILNPVFLNHLLVSNSIKNKLLGVGAYGGAVMEAITKEQLQGFEIIIPPIERQNKFEENINNLFSGKNSKFKSIERSNSLFNSLLQKAFNGELVA